MNNKKVLYKALIVFICLIVLYSIFFVIYKNVNNSNDDNEWNRSDDSPKYDSDSLYESSDIPTLSKLLNNANFILQVKFNRLSYLYGFSSDGNYMATIYYEDKSQAGYIINIDNIITSENDFSLFIPDNKFILESKELSIATEMVEKAYEINIPPSKLDWNNTFVYETAKGLWFFEEENNETESRFSISNSMSKDKWTLLLNDSYQPVYIEAFSTPKKPEWLTFVFYFEQFQNGISNYKTVFIDLNKLTNKSSNSGKIQEADRWLYGDFEFIYDQWEKYHNKGFIAIDKSTLSLENVDDFYDMVNQWVYMDTTGRMRWYGNSEGVFNSMGMPLLLSERGFSYSINLVEYFNKGLVYYIIDIFDSSNNSFIKTIEFLWDSEKQYMVPIQYKDTVL